jgi:hypothetical protein
MLITDGIPTGGSRQPLAGSYVLPAKGTGTERHYGLEITLSLPTGGYADGLRVLPETSLALSFTDHVFDARAADAVDVAQVDTRADGVLLSLPAPRLIERVRVSGAAHADRISAHRVDGDFVSDAVASATHGRHGAMLQVTDRTLLLRRNDAAITPTAVDSVTLRSSPANPRVSLAVSALPETRFVVADTPDFGTGFRVAVEAAVARLLDSLDGALLPPELEWRLHFVSDLPARLQITHFALAYRLSRNRFADAPTPRKTVLRFAGDSVEQQSVSVLIPPAVAVHAASIRVGGKFDGPAADDQGSTAADAPADPIAVGDDGLLIAGDASYAVRLEVGSATVASGGLITLVTTARPASLLLQLHGDGAGRPQTLLSELTMHVAGVGARRQLRFEFARPLLLAAGAVWLSVAAADGQVVLLLTDAGGGSTLRRRDDAGWGAFVPAGERRAAVTLLPAQTGVETAAGAGTRVLVAGQHTAVSAAGADRRFDFSASAQALAHNLDAVGDTLTLEVVSSAAGVLTVFAPEIEYDVLDPIT